MENNKSVPDAVVTHEPNCGCPTCAPWEPDAVVSHRSELNWKHGIRNFALSGEGKDAERLDAIAAEAYQKFSQPEGTPWREIVERVATDAIELAVTRHDLIWDEALEMTLPEIIQDAIHCLTGDDIGCGTEEDANDPEKCAGAFVRQKLASPTPVVSGQAEPEFLLPAFLEAMADIGRYGFDKYQDESFQARRARGDRDRGDMTRIYPDTLSLHAIEHFEMYLRGCPYCAHSHDCHEKVFAAFAEAYAASLRQQLSDRDMQIHGEGGYVEQLSNLIPARNKWEMLCTHFGLVGKETCVAKIADRLEKAEKLLTEAQGKVSQLEADKLSLFRELQIFRKAEGC